MNRPNEQITIYLPGKWSSDEISAIASRLPGVVTEQVATYDICSAAAKKGEQAKKKIIDTMMELAKIGESITQICKTILPAGFVRIKNYYLNYLKRKDGLRITLLRKTPQSIQEATR